MPDKIRSTIKLFADDSKLRMEIDSDNPGISTNILQSDIQQVTKWSEEWLMELNVEKCKIMHLGKKNPEKDYFMNCSTTNLEYKINSSISERDLGVQLSSNLLYKEQIAISTSKANKMLGVLKNSFISREETLWKKLYTTYVRSQLLQSSLVSLLERRHKQKRFREEPQRLLTQWKV